MGGPFCPFYPKAVPLSPSCSQPASLSLLSAHTTALSTLLFHRPSIVTEPKNGWIHISLVLTNLFLPIVPIPLIHYRVPAWNTVLRTEEVCTPVWLGVMRRYKLMRTWMRGGALFNFPQVCRPRSGCGWARSSCEDYQAQTRSGEGNTQVQAHHKVGVMRACLQPACQANHVGIPQAAGT